MVNKPTLQEEIREVYLNICIHHPEMDPEKAYEKAKGIISYVDGKLIESLISNYYVPPERRLAKKLLDHHRIMMIKEALSNTKTLREASEYIGISERQFYRILDKYGFNE